MPTNNTSPALFYEPVYGAQVSYVDWNQLFSAVLSICGKTIYASQGVPNGLPLANGLSIVPTGMNLALGGASVGSEWVVCDGWVCDTCPMQTFTVPNNTSGSPRVDSIEISHVLVETSTVSREVESNAAALTTNSFVIPAVGGTVSGIGVNSTSVFANGDVVTITDGAEAITGIILSGGGTTTLSVQVTSIPLGVAGDTVASGATITDQNGSGLKTMQNIPIVGMGVQYWYNEGASTPQHGGSIFALVTVPNNAASITTGDIAIQFPNLNPAGPAGASGANAYTTTTAGVVIPAVNSPVTVPVASGAPFPNGSYLVASDGTHGIHGQVTAGGGTTSLTVLVDAIVAGAQGNTIASGATVAPSGEQGAQGTQGPQGNAGSNGAAGHGATTSTSGITIPAVGSNVATPVSDATAFPVGTYGFISDGTHAFDFQVMSVASNTITIQNLGVVLGAVGNTVASGATVTFSGPPSSAGAIGSTIFAAGGESAVSLVLPGPSSAEYGIMACWSFSGIPGSISADLNLTSGVMDTDFYNGPLNSGSNGVQAGQTLTRVGTAKGGQTLTFTPTRSGSTTGTNPVYAQATRIS